MIQTSRGCWPPWPPSRAEAGHDQSRAKRRQVWCLAAVTGAIIGDNVRIVVSDEGPGIASDRLETVFEPFYRIEASRGRSTRGYGLGLTVARTIARAHGGDVILINRKPRGDAIMTLPIAT